MTGSDRVILDKILEQKHQEVAQINPSDVGVSSFHIFGHAIQESLSFETSVKNLATVNSTTGRLT